MADNRQVYPLGLGMDQAAAAEEPAADPASAAPIFGHRLGCALHVLHLAVMAGMTTPVSWALSAWPVCTSRETTWWRFSACVWCNISRSNTCNAALPQFQNLIAKHFVPEGTSGRLKFIKPAETR